jgi:LmbE family N-acetylglucosaminyl deacetylase
MKAVPLMKKLPPLPWKNAMVFAAHGDDEIIGCGGTIARLKAQGSRVTVVVFTGGETSYTTVARKASILEERHKEMDACDRVLAIDRRILLGLPTQGVVNTRETYQTCVRIIREIRPDVIFAHEPDNKHRDHRAVIEIVDEARWKASEPVLADMGKPWYTQELFYFENKELFPWPTHVVDITPFLKKKLAAMRTQTSQMSVLGPIVDYLEAHARTRGTLGECKYAEAFVLSDKLPKIL